MKKKLVSICYYLCISCCFANPKTTLRDTWGRVNYSSMLLFDNLSGRIIDLVMPQTHSATFHLRESGMLNHTTGFQNFIHIKRPPVPMKSGETKVVDLSILPIEFVKSKFIPDYRLSMSKHEFSGGSCFIWNIPEWEHVPKELNKQKELLLYSRISYEATRFDGNPIPHKNKILVDKTLYNKLVHRMRHSAPEPFYAPQFMNEGNKNYRKTRLDLARYSDGRLQTSGDEYVFEILLDRSSGYLAVYMRYQNKDEPKDLDVSEIRAKINPDRLHAMVWDYWIYPNTQSSRKIISAKAEHDAKRPDKECSENEEDNVFTIRINQVFGTVRPIWELEIWDELGRRIKESRNAYILYFNDEDIQYLKKPAISQHYLVVTGQLYEEMEALRKAMEKKKKREEERETLKEMMAQ